MLPDAGWLYELTDRCDELWCVRSRLPAGILVQYGSLRLHGRRKLFQRDDRHLQHDGPLRMRRHDVRRGPALPAERRLRLNLGRRARLGEPAFSRVPLKRFKGKLWQGLEEARAERVFWRSLLSKCLLRALYRAQFIDADQFL